MSRGQRQRGGTGSQQIQVAGDLVVGVSESRASEIAQAQARLVIQEFTAEAENVARGRIDDLDKRLISELDGRGLLRAFGDPAFQILLRKTQLHAAATEGDADHEILSKLLAERAQEPSKPMHMVVTRAVEAIEQIDDRALLGMTCLWFVASITPNAPDPESGLAYFDNLAAHFADDDLPLDTGWLERLDLMDCVNYQPPGGIPHLKKWHQILMAARPGYVCEGISAVAEPEVRAKLHNIHPGLAPWLVPHFFLPGHFRINAGSAAAFLEILGVPIEGIGRLHELEVVIDECKVDITSPTAASNMLDYVKSSLPNLDRIRQWWDSVQGGVEITPLGVAIAYSNAKRFDPLNGLGSLSGMLVRE